MVEIIDDIIPVSHQKLLEEIVTDISFDWHYLHDVTFEFKGDRNSPGFTNLLFQGGVGGDKVNVFYPPLHEYLFRKDLKIKTLHRMRLGCLLSNSDLPHNNPHIDFEFQHMVGLYYVNDSDGDTIIWDGDKRETVTPKRGRFAVFNGKYYHASSCPRVSPTRIVLTFNFTAQ